VDIGCGPGNSTEILSKRWSNAKIIGIDNSLQMIEKAEEDFPDGTWILSDAMSFSRKGEFDIVFSNAAIQWLPKHEQVIPHLLSLLKPKGVIAIQVPQNQNSPLQKALYETASELTFCRYTQGAKNILNYKTGHYYYNLLSDKTKELYIWETNYYHLLESHIELINWYKSTGMRPFLESLPSDDLRKEMTDSVLQKCVERYKKQSDNKIIFPFNRLFILGYLQ
jgi:trans-aconitate 2-methyltransferase